MSTEQTQFKEPLLSCHEYTLGADPEFFIFKEDGKLLPAFEFLPPKDNPEKIPVYWDGFQAEFGLDKAPTCITVLGSDIHKRLQVLHKWAANEGARIGLQNVVRVDAKILNTALDPHVALGCMPSNNVYKMAGEIPPHGRLLKHRFAGGHLHFGGWAPSEKMNAPKYIKALDKILGIWAVGAAQNIDVPVRRKYYGLAGEYRNTHYRGIDVPVPSDNFYTYAQKDGQGFEYRTLSNFYYCHPGIQQLTVEIARSTLTLVDEGHDELWAADEDDVVRTINTCNVERAKAILKRNEPMFKWLFSGKGWNPKERDLAFKIGMEGVEVAVGKPDDICDNWRLRDGEWGENYKFRAALTYAAMAYGWRE